MGAAQRPYQGLQPINIFMRERQMALHCEAGKTRGPATLGGMLSDRKAGLHVACLIEAEPRVVRPLFILACSRRQVLWSGEIADPPLASFGRLLNHEPAGLRVAKYIVGTSR